MGYKTHEDIEQIVERTLEDVSEKKDIILEDLFETERESGRVVITLSSELDEITRMQKASSIHASLRELDTEIISATHEGSQVSVLIR